MPRLPEPLPLISFEQILAEPPLSVEWDVEPLIGHGERVVIFGEFGSMKSWLLLDLGLHLAAGRPWLGKFAVPQSRRVLYVDEEMNEPTLRRRITRLGQGAGFAGDALPFHALSRAGVKFDAAGPRQLLSALHKAAFDPELVIVETIRRVAVGNENEAKDVAALWQNVEPILKAGKTLIVSHHMRKPRSKSDRANRDRASGSTDVLAGCDTAFAIHRYPGTDTVLVECVKSREVEEPAQFAVSLVSEGAAGPLQMRLGSASALAGEPGKLDGAMRLAIALFQPNASVSTHEILEYLATRGIAKRTAERVPAVLEKRGQIQKVSHGWWELVGASERA